MSNGNDNTLLLAGLTIAAIVGFYLYTEPEHVAPPAPPPPPPPQPGGGPGSPSVSPMPPFPAPKGYYDVGMNATTDAMVKASLASNNDPTSLQGLASELASQGFTSSASALGAKAFMLKQSDPTSLMISLMSAPQPLQHVLYTQPDATPVPGKAYHVATSSGLEFWATPGEPPPMPGFPTDFTPAILVPFGQQVIATGNDVGVIWEVVMTDAAGLVRLGWIKLARSGFLKEARMSTHNTLPVFFSAPTLIGEGPPPPSPVLRYAGGSVMCVQCTYPIIVQEPQTLQAPPPPPPIG